MVYIAGCKYILNLHRPFKNHFILVQIPDMLSMKVLLLQACAGAKKATNPHNSSFDISSNSC